MIQTIKNNKWWVFLATSVLLLTAGFWNGFPFLYPDDGTYFSSGFMPEMPLDRPITYGLFIFATSLGGYSLWLTVFAQSFLTTYVIYQTLKSFLKIENISVLFSIVILFLVFSSSISFLTSQLMPDCFTPLVLLTQLLLIANTPLSKKTRKRLFVIYFLATATHISHLPFNLLLIAIYVCLLYFFKSKFTFLKSNTILWLLGLTFLSLGTMLPPLAKSSHAFRIGAMIQKGILNKVLDLKCAEKNWQLCQYRDSMPKSLEDFLWSTSSPLNKIGLIESKKECNDIIWTSYTTPSLLKLHIDASIKATSQQLEYFSVCEGNAPFQKGTAVFEEFEKRFPRLTPQYLRSRQATNQLEIVNEFNYFLKYFVPFLLILCFILFFSEKIWSNERLRFFLIFIFLGIFLNAWLCSTLVYATNRYGTKMIWLIHLSFLLILVILFNKKHEFKDN